MKLQLEIFPKTDLYVRTVYLDKDVELCLFDVEDTCEVDLIKGDLTDQELESLIEKIVEEYRKV